MKTDENKVLGDKISSPPHTPYLGSKSVQPSPQEPAYISATYKPPSLYPNKKQRMNFVLEPVAPITTSSSFSSPGLPSAAFESNRINAPTKSDVTFPFPPTESSFAGPRRHSIQKQSSLAGIASPSPTKRNSQTYYNGGSSIEPRLPRTIEVGRMCTVPLQDRTPEDRRRVSSTLDTHWGVRADTEHDSSRKHSHPDFRRSSTTAYDQYRTRSPGLEKSRRRSYQVDTPYDMSSHGPIMERDPFECESFYSNRRPADITNGTHQNLQPSVFMPNHYDYQQGKTRKRSNLPKQSTEIMKTWFDQVPKYESIRFFNFRTNFWQNIANPYPSEDQKHIFSEVRHSQCFKT